MISSWTGGVFYIQNLVRAIASLPVEERNNIKLSIAVRASDLDLAKPICNCVEHVYVNHFLKHTYFKICKILAEYIPLIPTEALNLRKFDFVYPDVAGIRAPYVWGGWIPDFQHCHLPGFFSRQEIARRSAIHQKIAHAAPVIVLSSQMAQADFSRLYPGAASRSTVMSFVSYPEPKWFQLAPKPIQEKYGLPDHFFLVSNQFWQHKDHAVVIESMGLLKQQGISPTVVCTGDLTDYRHPQYYDRLIGRIAELGLNSQFRILGLIPRIDQIQLMRRCLAVIQPSLFEGWSTVVEDARALGKPVLVSDFPVHLEQNPPYSYFFERSNSEQLAALISTAFSKLNPGPDSEKENLAKQENVERVAAYGRRFLEIVRSVA